MSSSGLGRDETDPKIKSDASTRATTWLIAPARALGRAVAWAADRIGFLAP